MDIPVKFSTITPKIEDILQYFSWRRHPLLPEIELFTAQEKGNLKQLLIDNKHSWQWPYMWECGVTLARWILDNPHIVKDKVVYDLGTGQGTVAIAAKKAGAKIVVGVDCCEYSQFVLEANSERNNVNTVFYKSDIFKAKIPDGYVVFASDVVYGQQTSQKLLDYFWDLSSTRTVVLSQSGRSNNFDFNEINKDRFKLIMEMNTPLFTPALENEPHISRGFIPISLYTPNPLILQSL